MITSEQFLQDLRSALNHLYDPYFLRKSPLALLFNLGEQPDAPAALQRILIEAIDAMEPRSGDPNRAQRQRTYDLITYRYVQQFGQEEVANQLGLSVRHLRREQNAAIFDLGAYLWERYRLGARPLESGALEVGALELEEGTEGSGGAHAPVVPVAPATALPGDAVAENNAGGVAPATGDNVGDLEWLRQAPMEEPAELGQILGSVLDLSWSLAERRRVHINVRLVEEGQQESGFLLAVQPVALRQMLLTLLTVAIPREAGGSLEIGVIPQGDNVTIRVETDPAQSSARERLPLTSDENATLEIARQMAEISKGHLSLSLGPDPFQAELTLPVFRPRSVLVIDDNADFIQMIERFLSGAVEPFLGGVYRVVGERDPGKAIEAAIEHDPDIIFLDVMMPRIDGWEVLGRLRRHPSTAHIPVIVCTILAQEELALSLGARGFLRKPVTPERVLAALDAHCG